MDSDTVAGAASELMTPAVVWHALTAVLAWAVLAPVSQLLNRLPSSSTTKKSYSRFAVHRTATLVILVLTVQAYFVALYASSNLNTTPTPVTRKHPMFASLLVLLTIAQATGGFARPPAAAVAQTEEGEQQQPTSVKRRIWHVLHTIIGVALMFFGLWILQHSAFIFDVDPWLRNTTYVATAFGTVVTLCALIAAIVDYARREKEGVVTTGEDNANGIDHDYQSVDSHESEMDIEEGEKDRSNNDTTVNDSTSTEDDKTKESDHFVIV